MILTPIYHKDVFADTNDETGGKGIEIKAFGKANGGTGYHYVYLGKDKDNNPIKWRVLSLAGNGGTYKDGNDGAVSEDKAIFLLSEFSLEKTKFRENRDNNMWQGSLAQQWSQNFANNNLKDFEGAALLKTTKSDKEFSTFSEGLNDNVTFGAADGVLNDDKVFFLSGEEVYNPKFGFETEKSQITKLNKKAASWMLRSPSSENDLVIEVIDGYLGGATDAFVNSSSNAARPVVNLNKSNIVLATPVEAAKVDFSNHTKADAMEWKLTLKDSSNFSEGANVESDLAAGNVVNLPKDYSNKTVAVNHKKLSSFNKDYTNVTAVLKDVNGNILYYGSIGNDIESGKSMIAIPEKLAAGDYNVEVYGEKWNPNKESDSATGIPYIFTLKVAGDDVE